jgi:outer membrane protein assembly factor BamB
VLTAIALMLVAGAWVYYDRNRFLFQEAAPVLPAGGEQLWATELHDSFGTLYVPYSMDVQPVLNWQVEIPGGSSGGPVVYADGTLVIAGKENVLMAISPQGEILWQTALTAQPIGTPALDAQGNIYVADVEGYLTAFDSQGSVSWRAEASSTRQATSGPIVSSSGMIYLTMIDAVVGISPEGVLAWRKTATDIFVDSPPRMSSDESLVYIKDVALDSATGEIQEIQILPPNQVLFTEPAFFTGMDGGDYYRSGREVMEWRRDGTDLQVEPARGWQAGTFVLFNPLQQGITPNRLAWLFYSSEFSDGRMVWIDPDSRLIGNFEFPFNNSRLMAVGARSEAYICGPTGARIRCVAALPGSKDPQWEVLLDDNSRPIGGALVPGTLYVTSANGFLYALSTTEAGEP